MFWNMDKVAATPLRTAQSELPCQEPKQPKDGKQQSHMN
jgi:hypothetical protein